MSSTSKGKDFENRCADALKQMGYHIAFKSIRIRYGAIDLDGTWDILAMKREGDSVKRIYVQCKSKKLYGKEVLPYEEWVKKYGIAGENFFFAIKKKIKRRVAIQWLPILPLPSKVTDFEFVDANKVITSFPE